MLQGPPNAPPRLRMTPLLGPLPVRHGFFTRAGGVSTGAYASLNCSTSGGDDPAAVLENRNRVRRHLGATHLVGARQVHGAAVLHVDGPWPGPTPPADALITTLPGVAVGVITADCTPVLLAGPGVVGAVHAGWRGAVAGVLEATVAAMQAVSSGPIVAVIGPCIRQPSYEVTADLRDAVIAHDSAHAAFFTDGRPGHWHFDLAGYCAARLVNTPTTILDADTLADPDRFWSHRRRTLAGGGPIGHQISAIVL